MIEKFITSIIGEYTPVISTGAGGVIQASIDWGYIFDAVAILGFMFIIFRVLLIIIKGVFYK